MQNTTSIYLLIKVYPSQNAFYRLFFAGKRLSHCHIITFSWTPTTLRSRTLCPIHMARLGADDLALTTSPTYRR